MAMGFPPAPRPPWHCRHPAGCQQRMFKCSSAAREGVGQYSTPLTTAGDVRAYILQRPELFVRLFPGATSAHSLTIQELGAGKINFCWLIGSGSGGPQVVLKHAPPFVKSVGASFPLTQERLWVEVQAMQAVWDAGCRRHVPRVLFADQRDAVLVMEALAPPHTKVMLGLHADGLTYPRLAGQLAGLLVAIATRTGRDALGAAEHQRRLEVFANAAVVAANERVVLTDPMDPDCPSNHVPQNEGLVSATALFRADPVVREALDELVDRYRTDKSVLLHNDLHTGNLLATQDTLYCIDWEFATYGPPAFDLGCIIGNLVLAHLTLRSGTQRAWLQACLANLWLAYVQGMQDAGLLNGSPAAVFQDVAGYAALAVFRLSVGMHLYPGYACDQDVRVREKRQAAAVRVAHQIIALRQTRSASIDAILHLLVDGSL